MATAAIPGFKSSLYVAATSDSATGVKFGELREVTLTIASGAMDATSKDSAGWKENLVGLKEWSIAGSGLYLLESTNAGQVSAFEALRQGNLLGILLYASSSQGPSTLKYTGNVVVTGLDIESPLEGPAGIKLSAKGTGALTKAAATS